MAWKALAETYSGHTKEARKACQEKFINTKTKPGQDPDDLFFVLDEGRDLLEESRQTVHDERYEDIIFQVLPSEYERLRNARYVRQAGFWAGRHSAHGTHYIGTWYTLCTSTTFRARSTLSRSQVAASPCRWWGTTAAM